MLEKIGYTHVQQAGQELSDGKGIENATDGSAQDLLQRKGDKNLHVDDDLLDSNLELGDDRANNLNGSAITTLDAS